MYQYCIENKKFHGERGFLYFILFSTFFNLLYCEWLKKIKQSFNSHEYSKICWNEACHLSTVAGATILIPCHVIKFLQIVCRLGSRRRNLRLPPPLNKLQWFALRIGYQNSSNNGHQGNIPHSSSRKATNTSKHAPIHTPNASTRRC